MMPGQTSRAYELFEQALSRPPGERSAFLAGACGQDAELRAEVESLLDHDRRASDEFMRPPESGDGGLQAPSAVAGDPLVGG